MKSFIAYCGLDCEACEARILIAQAAGSTDRKRPTVVPFVPLGSVLWGKNTRPAETAMKWKTVKSSP